VDYGRGGADRFGGGGSLMCMSRANLPIALTSYLQSAFKLLVLHLRWAMAAAAPIHEQSEFTYSAYLVPAKRL